MCLQHGGKGACTFQRDGFQYGGDGSVAGGGGDGSECTRSAAITASAMPVEDLVHSYRLHGTRYRILLQ